MTSWPGFTIVTRVSEDPVPVETPTDPIPDLARIWWGYSKKVYGPDYPLYQALAAGVADNGDLLEMIAGCRPAAHDPNLLLASVQYLLLNGADHPLADLYGDRSQPDRASLRRAGALFSAFCGEHRDSIVDLLGTRHVQTNETGRCSGLAVGLAEAAARLGQPLNLVDAGASAGLNLAIDEYRLDFGAAGACGPHDSPVLLPCRIRGAPGFRAPDPVPIGRRVGLDRAPVDVTDEVAARWMLACIWPGKGRQERARAAMRLRAGRPLPVVAGDMVDDLGELLEAMRPGPTVVVTSWSYSYLPSGVRPRFLQILRDESKHQPLAWLCLDLLGVEPLFTPITPAPAGEPIPSLIGLAVLDTGRLAVRPVALTHSHGSWLRPLDEPYRPVV